MVNLYVNRPADGETADTWRHIAACPNLDIAGRVAAAVYSCYGLPVEVRDDQGQTWDVTNERGCPTRGQVCRAAQRVRDAQRAYFRDRNQETLQESKAAEAALDKLLAEYAAGPPRLTAPIEAPAVQPSAVQLAMDMEVA